MLENPITIICFEKDREPYTKTITGNLISFEREVGDYIKTHLYKKSESGQIHIVSDYDDEQVTSLNEIRVPCFLLKIDLEGKYVSLSPAEIEEILSDYAGHRKG